MVDTVDRTVADGHDPTRQLDGSEEDLDTVEDRALVRIERPALERGAQLGRYVVLSRLGEGAMGVVYSAYDPELDRRTAIKVLKHASISLRDRLMREAQALAKLSHPNVVAVYDVGEVGAQVFLAMEYVEGETLKDWGRSRRRWSEVLPVFIEAGRGIAAAHAAGLLHRDLKPENMMIAKDGRVRVMDFGLARSENDRGDPGDSRQAPRVDALATDLTQSGSVLGTPAYMPLEQLAGNSLTAATDQFAFCVSLYELLYGERPFEGTTLAALYVSVDNEKVRPAPLRSDVPGWLRAVIIRGLRRNAEDRWPSMDVLLEQLQRDPAAARRRWATFAGVAAVVGAVVVAQSRAVPRTRPPPCAGVGDEVTSVWSDAQKNEVTAALAATDTAFSVHVSAQVGDRIDAYVDAWRAARVDACEATRVRGDQSEQLMDLRMRCLDRRLQELDALVTVLREPDATIVERAVSATASLSSLSACADLEALQADHPPPTDPEAAERVEALMRELAKAEALDRSGKTLAARAETEALEPQIMALQHPPLTSAFEVRRGIVRLKTSALEASQRDFEAAYFRAVRHRMREPAARASSWLTMLIGERMGKPNDAQIWRRLARAHAENLGADAFMAHAALTGGMAAYAAGDYAGATESHREAAERWANAGGPEHPNVAVAKTNLGNALMAAGDLKQSRIEHEAALAIWEKLEGPDHPQVATCLSNLSMLADLEEDPETARKLSLRALEIETRTFGADSVRAAVTMQGLGNVETGMGRTAEARAHLDAALAVFEDQLGKDHPNVGATYDSLGDVDFAEQDFANAEANYRRGVEIYDAALGSEHPSSAMGRARLARAVGQQGRLAEAARLYTASIGDIETALGPQHPALAEFLTGFALVRERQGRVDEAAELRTRAETLETQD